MSSDTATGLRDGTRVVVRGAATAEEVAAVVAALDTALATPAAPARRVRPWTRAARLEATAGHVVRTRADLLAP